MTPAARLPRNLAMYHEPMMTDAMVSLNALLERTSDAGMLREMRETVPLGRFGNEAETAAAINFLLSPAASFISGTVMRVDGARPQARMGWGQIAAPEEVQQRDAVKPFDGFHRYVTPKLLQP